ncbi:MAG: hypothetical protein P1U56_10985 [Saprospiraceae bacterium]|nr:hypothetical protein [Saprospiraceae bacterium]
MNLPNLSAPVVRNANTRFSTEGVNPSNAACTACCIAANALPWPASIAAKAACKAIGGCSC